MYPEQLYEYEFLDQQTAQFYEAEQSMLQLIQVSSLSLHYLSVAWDCMGLFPSWPFKRPKKSVFARSLEEVLVIYCGSLEKNSSVLLCLHLCWLRRLVVAHVQLAGKL